MPEPQRLPRVLGATHAFSVVVGGVIGASIFLVPSVVARHVHSLTGIAAVWILGAALTLSGVLTVCELSAMLPSAGGGYVYIREAFGEFAAFLFGWTDALLIRAGAAATIAFTSSIYLSQIIPSSAAIPEATWQSALAILTLIALATLNTVGAKVGAEVQVAGTSLKILALASGLILPLILWRGPNELRSIPLWPQSSSGANWLAALIPVLWTYGGWEQLAHLAEEVKDPSRVLPRVLTTGMLTVAALYLMVVAGIHYVVPHDAVASNTAIGAELFNRLIGNRATLLFACVVAISAAISANAALMAGPRTCFAIARDGVGPAWLARVQPRFGTPAGAIALVAGWSVTLIAASAALAIFPPPAMLPFWMSALWNGFRTQPLFEVLISYVMFGYLGYLALTVASALVLRRKHPEWHRPFRIPFYPWTPLLSLAATTLLAVTIAIESPLEAIVGTLIVFSGLPVWAVYRRRSASDPTLQPQSSSAEESRASTSKL